jgi:hypothetical protein
MALVLLGILTVCPLMACGLMLDNRCCHDSQSPPTSCPKTTLQECPYSLLEKGKTATAMAHVLSAALEQVSHAVSVPDAYSFIPSTNRVPSSNGLYRIRVLLI